MTLLSTNPFDHGQLVDVGGFTMFLRVEGSAVPPVVLDAGWGDGGWLDWYSLLPEISKFARVVAYDRAGIGWSDSSPHARSGEQFAIELNALLSLADIVPPYILVGHSFGGLTIREFARTFPDRVAGAVMIDSSHEAQNTRFSERIQQHHARQWNEQKQVIEQRKNLSNREIVAQEKATLSLDFHSPFGPDVEDLMWSRVTDKSGNTLLKEMEWANTLPPTNKPFLPKNCPLWVLTSGRPMQDATLTAEENGAWQSTWAEMQKELASLSANSNHIIVQDAGHYVHWEKPRVVIAAIRDVFEQVRAK